MFTLVIPSFAETKLRIAAQEGDERFYPLLRTIYEQIGVKVEFQIFPSARALLLANKGDFDAEVGRIYEISSDYPNLVYSREPLLTSQLTALVKRDSKLQLSSAEELKRYRVGYLIGMRAAEQYVKKKHLNTSPVVTHEQLAQMLVLDRIDIALMGTAFFDSPVYQVGVVKLVVEESNVYHILHKKYSHLIPEFDSVLHQMKASGQYKQLLQSAPKF